MRKRIISAALAALMLLGATGCASSGADETTADNSVNVNTSTRFFPTQYVYEIVTTGQEQTASYTYDEDWNLIRIVMTLDGTEAGTVDYEVDDHGNLVSQINTTNGLGQVVTYENTYDDYGNLTQQAQSVDGESCALTQATYDENGNQTYVKTTQYNAYGFMVYEYYFDESGNVLKEITDYGDGSSATTEYTYDAQGNQLTATTVDTTGTRTSVTEYENGRTGKVTETDTSGDVSQYAIYSYEGNVTTITTYDGQDHMTGKTVETYDEAGNLLSQEQYGPEGELYSRATWTYTEVPEV